MLGVGGRKVPTPHRNKFFFFPPFQLNFFFFLNADQHYQKWPFHQTHNTSLQFVPFKLHFFSRQQGTKKGRRGNVRWKKRIETRTIKRKSPVIKGWSKKKTKFNVLFFLDSFPYHMSLDTEKEDQVCMR